MAKEMARCEISHNDIADCIIEKILQKEPALANEFKQYKDIESSDERLLGELYGLTEKLISQQYKSELPPDMPPPPTTPPPLAPPRIGIEKIATIANEYITDMPQINSMVSQIRRAIVEEEKTTTINDEER